MYRKEPDGKKYVKYEVIGANNVAVPTHFFKILVGETSDGKFEMEAYVLPNQVIDDKTPLNVFQVKINKYNYLIFINKPKYSFLGAARNYRKISRFTIFRHFY